MLRDGSWAENDGRRGRAATGMYFARKRAGRASSTCRRCDARARVVFERSVAPDVSRRCRGFSSRLRIAQGRCALRWALWFRFRRMEPSPRAGAARSCRLPRTVALGPTLSSAEVRVPAVAPGLSPTASGCEGSGARRGKESTSFPFPPVRRSRECPPWWEKGWTRASTACQSSPLGLPCRRGVEHDQQGVQVARAPRWFPPPSSARCQRSASGEALRECQAPASKRCTQVVSTRKRWSSSSLSRIVCTGLRSVQP